MGKGNKFKAGSAGTGSMVYCLGIIGAAIYYIQHAQSFSEGFIGVLKSLVWPAIVVYKVQEFLKF